MKIKYLLLFTVILITACNSDNREGKSDAFQFELNFTYPGTQEFIYDHLTGDISEWWDHSFTEDPYKLYIEAKPGGGFYEIFDESGDGAKHATIIYAKRGEMLRMEGPLGLSGKAINLVCTYTLKPSGKNATILTLNVNGSGEFTAEIPGLVKDVWEHFLWEQFKPYIESRGGINE